MANNRLTFEGLEELKAQLRALPATLADEATSIVFDAANGAADAIVAAYPSRTGDLKNHVSVSVKSSGPFGVQAKVTNTSEHAVEFEIGTQARHTSLGANRGTMPAKPVFVPRIVQARRGMYGSLKAMLERNGLVVTGDV